MYSVGSDAEATQIFEFQNDRGKRLTDLEAVKSFLMHGIYLYSGIRADNNIKVIQDDFSAIYRAAEKLENSYGAPGEDQLLSYHCVAYETWVTLSNDSDGWRYPKQLAKHLLDKVPIANKSAWIKDFSGRLNATFTSATKMLDARDTKQSGPLGELFALDRTAPFWPMLLKCWGYDQSQGKTDFFHVVRKMEHFAFRSMIAGKRSDTGESALRGMASDFRGNFQAAITELTRMADDWEIPKYFVLGLNSENFYGYGGVATYLLWRYENFLRAQTGTQYQALSWKDYTQPANNAVALQKDHIEPKDENNPALARMVKWEQTDLQTRPFKEVYLHRLGNLVLDTFSAGGAKHNGNFVNRIPYYSGSTY